MIVIRSIGIKLGHGGSTRRLHHRHRRRYRLWMDPSQPMRAGGVDGDELGSTGAVKRERDQAWPTCFHFGEGVRPNDRNVNDNDVVVANDFADLRIAA